MRSQYCHMNGITSGAVAVPFAAMLVDASTACPDEHVNLSARPTHRSTRQEAARALTAAVHLRERQLSAPLLVDQLG
jgi:hypothetical protein